MRRQFGDLHRTAQLQLLVLQQRRVQSATNRRVLHHMAECSHTGFAVIHLHATEMALVADRDLFNHCGTWRHRLPQAQ